MASCKIATAPINISDGGVQPCENMCNLTYNYGNSSCTVSNKRTYLDIACSDGKNTVNFGITGSVRPVGVRLYQPSLNTYDGFKAAAELIITHTGGGRNVYICVPVESSSASGSSAKWFSQFMNFVNNKGNSDPKHINVQNFTLNDVIPQASFYIYQGGTFDWGCDAKDIMIIFRKKMTMGTDDYKTLVKLTDKAAYNVSSKPANLEFNKIGTTLGTSNPHPKKAGNGTLTCTPVTDQDGNNIEGTDTSKFPFTSAVKGADEGTDKAMAKVWTYIYVILAILGGLIVTWGLGWVFKSVFSRRKSGLSGGTASSSS